MKKWWSDYGISEAWHQVMDEDLQWWPFAFLKPQPDEYLSQARLFLLALLHALPITLLLSIVARLDGTQIALLPFCLSTSAGAHFVLWLVFGLPWNRRARALKTTNPTH